MNTVELNAGTGLQRLPLYLHYEKLGIPLIEHDSWLLPRKFRDISEEVGLLERGKGYVDFSDHGILKMEGNDAGDLLHRISANDFRAFKEGNAAQTVLLSEKGRLIDSVVVLHRNDHLLVITSRNAHRHVAQWIAKFIIMEDVKLSDETGRHLIFFHCAPHDSGFTPISDGGEIYTFKTKYFDIESIFYIGEATSSITSALESSGMVQVGNEAYEIFRIRKGISAYGKEITADYNPLELALRGQMCFSKGCYIGQEVIARLDTYKKVHKKLCRVHIDDTLLSNEKYRLFADGKETGILTSHVPNIGRKSGSTGLAIVKSDFASAGVRFVLDPHGSCLTIEDVAENVR